MPPNNDLSSNARGLKALLGTDALVAAGFELLLAFAPAPAPVRPVGLVAALSVDCAGSSELTVKVSSSFVVVDVGVALRVRVREDEVVESSSEEELSSLSSSPPEPIAVVAPAEPVRVAVADPKDVVGNMS